MYKDTAIDEIRARRRKLFKTKYHNDVSELVAAGKKLEQEHPELFTKSPATKARQKLYA